MVCKVVFMGSPDFALPTLQGLVQHYQVVGVVTQPDRPAGRGRTLTPPPIKLLADELRLPVIQPGKLRQPGVYEQLQAWQPDVIVVTAFGQILRQNVLEMAPFGCVNVHASLLPRWRGAAPIQASLLAGDVETGVTIMKMDVGIDTGPILVQQTIPISPNDSAESLSARLASDGADLLIKTLPAYLAGEIKPVPQPEEGASYAGMIKKEDGLLDFQQPAVNLVNRLKAFTPWPGGFMVLEGETLKIKDAHIETGHPGKPGDRGQINGLPAVCTSMDWLVLDEVQPAGKKAMPGDVFLRGARHW